MTFSRIKEIYKELKDHDYMLNILYAFSQMIQVEKKLIKLIIYLLMAYSMIKEIYKEYTPYTLYSTQI